MNTVYVISKEDFKEFGCPHCGNECSSAISIGGCDIGECRNCEESSLAVTSFSDTSVIKISKSKVVDLVDHHPFKLKPMFESGFPQPRAVAN